MDPSVNQMIMNLKRGGRGFVLFLSKSGLLGAVLGGLTEQGAHHRALCIASTSSLEASPVAHTPVFEVERGRGKGSSAPLSFGNFYDIALLQAKVNISPSFSAPVVL